MHEQWGKYEVYIPWENKRIRGDHGIIVIIVLSNVVFNVLAGLKSVFETDDYLLKK